MATTFTKRIDADIRDVENYYNGSSWYADESGAWYLGRLDAPDSVHQNISLRFTGVTVPQGATISSAKITFVSFPTQSVALVAAIKGVAQDNTAEFVTSPEDTARTRTQTTASVTWSGTISQTAGAALDTPDIKTLVQEIVNRAGWSSGNAMAFYLYNTGSAQGKYLDLYEYYSDTTKAALLTITYIGSSFSPSLSPSLSPSFSPSLSPSVSPSLSPSAGGATSFSPSISPSVSPSLSPSVSLSPSKSPSLSPSVSLSPSRSPSVSPSVSPSPPAGDYGFKIVKPGYDVKTEGDPKNFIFNSARGVLGLRQLTTYTKTTDASGNIASNDNHSMGYTPVTIVSFTAYDGRLVLCPVEWHSIYLNGLRETLEVTETVSFQIDGTKIYFNVHAEQYNYDTDTTTNISGRDYTFNVYYYFNEITEVY